MAAFRRAVPLLVAFVVVAFFSLGPTPHHFGCLQTQARASTGRAVSIGALQPHPQLPLRLHFP